MFAVVVAALTLSTPNNGAAAERPLGSFVEGTHPTFDDEGNELDPRPFAGYVAHATYGATNYNVIVTQDGRLIFEDWTWPGFSDETSQAEDYNITGLAEAQALWGGGSSGASIPEIGVDVAEYIEEAIGTMAAVAVAAIGGYFAFCLAVRALQWVSIAMGYQISDDYVPTRDLSELEWHQMTPFERQWLEREWDDEGFFEQR